MHQRFTLHAPRFVILAFLLLAGSVFSATYQNPVIRGDTPDPSIIRVGKDYWATCTSSEWGPQFPLFHSTDLVNWEVTGNVFAHRPDWAVANFWAPEISEYNGKYFVYYVGRKKGGPLAVAVATADKPTGPYTDHGPLVAQDAGSIDPVPVTDEKGQRYLVWKEDGNSRKLPTIIWAQSINDDLTLQGHMQELIRNDASWEGAVVEGPFIVRRGDWFYMFYSGGGCCGVKCSYGLGVARSKSLLGPWEKNPANPILGGNNVWKCPGHGSIVQDEQGRYWLLYHAYSTATSIFTGREGMLDEVKFGADGWPAIDEGHGPSVVANSPFGTEQKRNYLFETRFEKEIGKGWNWPVGHEPRMSLEAVKGIPGRVLKLTGSLARTNDILDGILARPTTSGDYTATATVCNFGKSKGEYAGLAAIGDDANAVGLAVGAGGNIVLWRRDRGQHKVLSSTNSPSSSHLHLKMRASEGSTFQFAYSTDGKQWNPIGNPQSGEKFPPWDRGIRVGLTVGGQPSKGFFEEFKIEDAASGL